MTQYPLTFVTLVAVAGIALLSASGLSPERSAALALAKDFLVVLLIPLYLILFLFSLLAAAAVPAPWWEGGLRIVAMVVALGVVVSFDWLFFARRSARAPLRRPANAPLRE